MGLCHRSVWARHLVPVVADRFGRQSGAARESSFEDKGVFVGHTLAANEHTDFRCRVRVEAGAMAVGKNALKTVGRQRFKEDHVRFNDASAAEAFHTRTPNLASRAAKVKGQVSEADCSGNRRRL